MFNHKIKILIADDNNDFIDAFKYQLVDYLGKNVDVIDTAENGIDALEKINTHYYDYVFMDINMPVMDGIKATKSATIYRRDIYIIAISFHKEIQYIEQMIKAGARNYLLKEEIDEHNLEKIFIK